MAIIGYNTIGGSGDTVGTNWTNEATVLASLVYTAVSGDTVTEFAVYGGAGSAGATSIAIYEVSGTTVGNRAGSAVTVNIGTGAGWDVQAVSIALTAGLVYCIAIQWSGTGVTTGWTMAYDNPGGTATREGTVGGGPLPATWTNGSTHGGVGSFYATVTAGGTAARSPRRRRPALTFRGPR